MRLWTLHPRYLDRVGLVALWREALLAKAVLCGRTVGYRNHPQLDRFRSAPSPKAAIGSYLKAIWMEATSRGYSFDVRKVPPTAPAARIPVSRGQVHYELGLLMLKLRTRDPLAFRRLVALRRPHAHPLFHITPGPVEPWERTRAPGRNRP